MDLDKEKKDEAPPPPADNPASPVESSSSSSAVSEVVLWTHSDSSDDDDDELDKSANSMLDFRSPSFNPLLALKCDSLELVPVARGAKQYLNLQQYSKAVPSPSKSPKKSIRAVNELAKKDEDPKKPEEPKPGPSSSSSSATPHYPIPGRRFLPHQLPVYRPRKEHPNTITLMNTSEGPLSVLKRVMTQRTRIKIWTRNEKGFRGFLTGFVEAFDKHWNIALRDVDEQFVRKKVIKFPIIGDSICEEQVEKIIEQSESEDKYTIPRGTSDTTRNNNGDDNDNKKKEQAISSAFIRLKNYLRQNDGITRKRIGSTSATTTTVTTTISTQTNKNKSSRKNSPSSSSLNDIAATTKSKTVYVGDMDPLSICRTGLANLSLRDDIHQPKKHDDSSSRRSTPTTQIKTRMSTKITKPDIIQCHQTRRSTTSSAGGAECSSSSTSAAASASSSTYSTQQDQQQQQNSPNIISRTSLKKKSLTVFKTPYEDSFGFMVVAQTRKYELVERHVGQVLLMGNDIVFIETSASGS